MCVCVQTLPPLPVFDTEQWAEGIHPGEQAQERRQSVCRMLLLTWTESVCTETEGQKEEKQREGGREALLTRHEGGCSFFVIPAHTHRSIPSHFLVWDSWCHNAFKSHGIELTESRYASSLIFQSSVLPTYLWYCNCFCYFCCSLLSITMFSYKKLLLLNKLYFRYRFFMS